MIKIINLSFSIFSFFLFLLLVLPDICLAQESYKNNRDLITVVIPVRSREYWKDTKNLEPQFDLLSSTKIPSTILLTYQAITDHELLDLLISQPVKNEFGIFLEVDQKLADDSYVPYLFGEGDKARADKILLSGYKIEERLRMIDQVFQAFKNAFGVYPRSVGAWYIDSVSLNYLKGKYHISAVLECSDQYETDTYGIWGKPFSHYYLPSAVNSFIPSMNLSDSSGVVQIQWAQRDPYLSYGLTVNDSTYSLQANDYLRHGLDIKYFEYLSGVYLLSNQSNDTSLGQLTVGLEAGQEGTNFFSEFKKQVSYLINLSLSGNIGFATMGEFFKVSNLIPIHGENLIYSSSISNHNENVYWYDSKFYRAGIFMQKSNLRLRDLRLYYPIYPFRDILTADRNPKLERYLTGCIDDLLEKNGINLSGDVKDIKTIKTENGFELVINENNGRKRHLNLSDNKIQLDGQLIFESDRNFFIDFLREFYFRLLINYQTWKVHRFLPSIRLTTMEGVKYFGIQFIPSKFIGFINKYPFFIQKEYPFQILSRFKTLDLNIIEVLNRNLVNYRRNCKI